MSGVVGLDLQKLRTVIALYEGTGTRAQPSLVGDGRRWLVPNAGGAPLPGDGVTADGVTRDSAGGGARAYRAAGGDATWGSAAVDACIAEFGPEMAASVELVDAWRVDPWSPEFLRGIYLRLVDYLGRLTPTHRDGYHVCVCTPTGLDAWAPPGSAALAGAAGAGPGASPRRERPAPDPAEVSRHFAAAGLTGTSLVRPTDALLCRWLAEPVRPEPPSGEVVSVACGEAWTAVAGYRVDDAGGRRVVHRMAGTSRLVELGTGLWCAELARSVLERCRESVPPSVLPGLLDSVLEFGAYLRARPAEAAVEWTGPLSDRMFAPLRLRRQDIAVHAEVRRVTDAVSTLVSTAAAAGRPDGRPLVLLGGLGAIWPFVADALRPLGTVWQSQEPERDLAVGAGWWSRFRQLFADPADIAAPPAPLVASLAPVGPTDSMLDMSGGGGVGGGAEPAGGWDDEEDDETPPWGLPRPDDVTTGSGDLGGDTGHPPDAPLLDDLLLGDLPLDNPLPDDLLPGDLPLDDSPLDDLLPGDPPPAESPPAGAPPAQRPPWMYEEDDPIADL